MDLFLRRDPNTFAGHPDAESRPPRPDSSREERRSAREVQNAPEAAPVPLEEAYGSERKYDTRRARRRAVLGIVRAVLLVLAVPLMMAVVFVVSYALTCILDGATPEELIEALAMLYEQARELFTRALSAAFA